MMFQMQRFSENHQHLRNLGDTIGLLKFSDLIIQFGNLNASACLNSPFNRLQNKLNRQKMTFLSKCTDQTFACLS